MEKKGYRKLKVWVKAHQLALEIYKTSKSFPKEELYGLSSQIRRAAFSVPLNIVEGQASVSNREFHQFLNIANRSLVETEYLLETLQELEILSAGDYARLDDMRNEIGLMLHALMIKVSEKQKIK